MGKSYKERLEEFEEQKTNNKKALNPNLITEKRKIPDYEIENDTPINIPKQKPKVSRKSWSSFSINFRFFIILVISIISLYLVYFNDKFGYLVWNKNGILYEIMFSYAFFLMFVWYLCARNITIFDGCFVNIICIIGMVLPLLLLGFGLSSPVKETDYAIPGKYVCFGSYEQDNIIKNGSEPLIWDVLDRDRDGNSIIMISKYAIDIDQNNSDEMWDNFIESSFSEDEKEKIREYGYISVDAFSKYELSIKCKSTAYAAAKGLGKKCAWYVHNPETDSLVLVNANETTTTVGFRPCVMLNVD